MIVSRESIWSRGSFNRDRSTGGLAMFGSRVRSCTPFILARMVSGVRVCYNTSREGVN